MEEDLPVMVKAYEGGLDIVTSVDTYNTEYKDDQPWYYGNYWAVSDKDIASKKEIIKAVYIGK